MLGGSGTANPCIRKAHGFGCCAISVVTPFHIADMPPTTRQSHKGVRWAQVQSQRKALSSGLANTRGLPIFPAELLLEIVNHFCSAPIPFAPTNNNPLDPHFGDRSAALRMLSQLCRSLRRNLLPKTWRHLEVCSRNLSLEECKPLRGFRGSIFTPWEKGIATELVKQLEIVTIRNPSLPQYVQYVLGEFLPPTPANQCTMDVFRIVSVFIGHYSCGGVIAELARCLSLFPNLRTLQIGAVSSVIATLGRLAFKGRTYPTIHTLAIPADHEWFMKSCPGLRHLHIIEDTISFPMDMRGVVKLFGPQLETLGGDLDLRTLAGMTPSALCRVQTI